MPLQTQSDVAFPRYSGRYAKAHRAIANRIENLIAEAR